ncbi:MAG TPA: alpha/beta hydrolase [Thermopolyspora sp.]
MKKTFFMSAAAGTCLSLLLVALPAHAEPGPGTPGATAEATTGAGAYPSGFIPAPPIWRPCDDLAGLDCAKVKVPLDYDRLWGPTIKIAITRRKATAPTGKYRGILLFNPGGPGGSGRAYPSVMPDRLGAELAATYDLIGFDPRGVGRSEPHLTCDTHYFDPVRPDYVPGSPGEESAWLKKTQDYAAACERAFGWLLPHMGTANSARDMDVIRQALGADTLSYVGYSYGTYLGATYATLFPDRVRHMVLDSVVRPSGIWYQDDLDQDLSFERRAHDFFTWIAAYDSVYHLGGTGDDVERGYYAIRTALKSDPAGGIVGPDEFDDTFLAGGYLKERWPRLADALAAYAGGDPAFLVDVYRTYGDQTGDDNGYAVYTAVECADAAWPEAWSVWHRDVWANHQKAPFLTWGSAWYNVPCRSWARPRTGGAPVDVRERPGLPVILLFQDTRDAATPYEGAVEMHARFPGSRLVVMEGGGDHGLTGRGDPCVDGYWKAYLIDGSVPASRPGPDAYCAPFPDPVPLQVRPAPATPAATGRRPGEDWSLARGGTSPYRNRETTDYRRNCHADNLATRDHAGGRGLRRGHAAGGCQSRPARGYTRDRAGHRRFAGTVGLGSESDAGDAQGKHRRPAQGPVDERRAAGRRAVAAGRVVVRGGALSHPGPGRGVRR